MKTFKNIVKYVFGTIFLFFFISYLIISVNEGLKAMVNMIPKEKVILVKDTVYVQVPVEYKPTLYDNALELEKNVYKLDSLVNILVNGGK